MGHHLYENFASYIYIYTYFGRKVWYSLELVNVQFVHKNRTGGEENIRSIGLGNIWFLLYARSDGIRSPLQLIILVNIVYLLF